MNALSIELVYKRLSTRNLYSGLVYTSPAITDFLHVTYIQDLKVRLEYIFKSIYVTVRVYTWDFLHITYIQDLNTRLDFTYFLHVTNIYSRLEYTNLYTRDFLHVTYIQDLNIKLEYLFKSIYIQVT